MTKHLNVICDFSKNLWSVQKNKETNKCLKFVGSEFMSLYLGYIFLDPMETKEMVLVACGS